MTDIQEQVERFIRWYLHDCSSKRGTSLVSYSIDYKAGAKLKALLWSVVEECCKAAQSELDFWFKNTESEVPGDVINRIRREFAWLEEK